MANDGPNPWKQNARDAAARIEDELHRVVTYINDQVVPDIRRDGSVALRAAAEQLQRLAQHIDDRRTTSQAKATPPPDSGFDKDNPQT